MPTVTLIGQSVVASAGNFRISSSDWHEFFYDQQLIVDSNATANQVIGGQSAEISQSTINESGESNSQIFGIGLIASLGNAVFSGTENVSVLISGVDSISSVGNVSASQVSEQVWSSGKIQRYPANAFKYANIVLPSIQSELTVSDVNASGTKVISVGISISGFQLITNVNNVEADGIISISDEELIVLLAA